jgi:membrane protease YdiL (CAAX protease family)
VRIITFFVLFVLLLVIASISFELLFDHSLHPRLHHHVMSAQAAEFFSEAIAAACALLAAWILVRFADKRQMGEIWFRRQGALGQFFIGAIVGVVMISSATGEMDALHVYHFVSVNRHFVIWWPILAFLAVAVFEEVALRGYVLFAVESRHGTAWAVGISSIVFGLLHLLNHQGARGPVFVIFEAGFPLAAAYLLTRSLWMPIGLHFAWNFFEGPLYGMGVSGENASNVLLKIHMTGRTLENGGSFGPEAGLPCLITCTLIGAGMLWLSTKGPHAWVSAKEAAQRRRALAEATEVSLSEQTQLC